MTPRCRFCGASLKTSFVDLGMSPIANDNVAVEAAMAMEPFYPLCAFVCDDCLLVQLVDFSQADALFSPDYAYFSSFSTSWLDHAKAYARGAIARESLDTNSLVVEVASNDGYLLQYFKAAGVKVLGVEPTRNTAAVAFERHGIESEEAFFGRETATRLAERGLKADLMAANNVLAHVPDINDFVAGFKILLKEGGVANFEFPHLMQLIAFRQFDTIYHEHFSYLSLGTCRRIFAAQRLRIYDVEALPTHGGSLRVYVCHEDDHTRHDSANIADMLRSEAEAGLNRLETYSSFAGLVVETKLALLEFLTRAHREGKMVAGYGAPAKGNTLLNYCGIKPDLLRFTVDRSPHKAGRLLPGSRIPILTLAAIEQQKPDYVLILPWNLKEEVIEQMGVIRNWGGRFVTPIPTLQIHE